MGRAARIKDKKVLVYLAASRRASKIKKCWFILQLKQLGRFYFD
jgi:hypothetical protein